MSKCASCLAGYQTDFGVIECRRNPPQIIATRWTGAACDPCVDEDRATPAQLADRRNWLVVTAYPRPDDPCGDFVHRV
jgi:hypothetical protein